MRQWKGRLASYRLGVVRASDINRLVVQRTFFTYWIEHTKKIRNEKWKNDMRQRMLLIKQTVDTRILVTAWSVSKYQSSWPEQSYIVP